MGGVKIKIEDKPMYSVGFERLAPEDETEADDIVELLAAMASFADGWIVPTRVQISVIDGEGFLATDVSGADAIPATVMQVTEGNSPGIWLAWSESQGKLPAEVEFQESTTGAFSVVGSTDHGNMTFTVGIYWSAWLQFPAMLKNAIERVLDRPGWARAEWSRKQDNHWQVQEWLDAE